MNKDKVYLKGYVIGRAADTLGYQGLMVQLENLDVVEIDKNLVHRDINEPQKVTVPQFVADWIEHTKKENYHIFGAIQATESDDMLDDWMWCDDNMEIFARAWLDGYEVEKEKRYLVKIIGMSKFYECLNFDTTENRWKFFDCDNTKTYRTHHTRKELEQAGFDWVFDCPGVEVEEV